MRKVLLLVALLALVTAPATAAQFYEQFNYADGELVGNGGWGGQVGIVGVSSATALVTYNDTLKGTHVTINFDPISAPMIYFSADVKAGGSAGQEGNAFDILANDSAGLNFARWYGGYNSERPRINGFGVVGTGVTLTGGWDKLFVEINTVAKTSTFYFNGVNEGSLVYSTTTYNQAIGSAVSQIQIGLQNAAADKNGAFKWYDNIYVGTTVDPIVPEPSSLLALSTLALGALGLVRRRK